MLGAITTALHGKQVQSQRIGKKVMCRNLYLEAFDHRASEIQMHPLFSIGGIKEKTIEALANKKESYLQEIEIDKVQIAEFYSWIEEQLQTLSTIKGSAELTSVHEGLVKLELDIAKYKNELDIQQNYLKNLTF